MYLIDLDSELKNSNCSEKIEKINHKYFVMYFVVISIHLDI